MSTLRTLVEKHYTQINTNDFANSPEIFSADVETIAPGSGPVRGIEAFLAYGAAFHTAFPDARIEANHTVESGDTIMVEGRYTGTHTGPLVGSAGTLPPTGRTLDLPYCDVFRVADGKIVEHRVYFDQVDVLTQLGLMPAPAMA
jgi:ketosteroid isomerase-like protein